MSTLRVNSLLNAAGTDTPAIDGLAKAWVNFDGTGTVAIRAAFNVSSITDVALGTYRVNYATAFPDQAHAPIAFCTDDGVSNRALNIQNTNATYNLTTSCMLTTWQKAGGNADSSGVYVAVFR